MLENYGLRGWEKVAKFVKDNDSLCWCFEMSVPLIQRQKSNETLFIFLAIFTVLINDMKIKDSVVIDHVIFIHTFIFLYFLYTKTN
jgi:hypothetical protein